MSTEIDTPLTPARRLGRGVAHTAAGPVDIARGALGVTAQAVVGTVSGLRNRYQASKLRRDLADAQNAARHELAAAQEMVAALPQALSEARGGRRRLFLGAAAVTAVLGGGAAVFSAVRRSRQSEPSPLPPSVSVEPQP